MNSVYSSSHYICCVGWPSRCGGVLSQIEWGQEDTGWGKLLV